LFEIGWLALLIASLLLGGSPGPAAIAAKSTSPAGGQFATVRDKHGQIVSNLGRTSSTWRKMAARKRLRYSRDTDLPDPSAC
jgi:hypothetical protein